MSAGGGGLVAIGSDTLLDAMDGIAYVTTVDGVVLGVAPTRWLRFAAENGGGERLAPGDVVGRSLFDFLAGDEVRAVNRRLAATVAKGAREVVVLDARCDGPAFYRRIRLTVSPIRAGAQVAGLLYQSILVEERLRPRMELFAHQAGATLDRELPMLVICSYCHSVQDGPAQHWREPEAYYRDGGTGMVRISHGICPSCFSQLEAQLG